MVKNYNKYNKEKKLSDGRYGFFMFLFLIDETKKTFIKTNNYLNIGNFLYFFHTDKIRNNKETLNKLKFRDSISYTYNTLLKLEEEKLCYYFGIRNKKLEYGFYDDFKDTIYKTGEFNITSKYVRSLSSYKCLSLIRGILKKTNIKSLTLLHKIKGYLKNFLNDKPSKITILDEIRMRKTISKDQLKDLIKNENDLNIKFVRWSENFSWSNSCYSYVDDQNDDEIYFYIKIKGVEDFKLLEYYRDVTGSSAAQDGYQVGQGGYEPNPITFSIFGYSGADKRAIGTVSREIEDPYFVGRKKKKRLRKRSKTFSKVIKVAKDTDNLDRSIRKNRIFK